MTAGPSAASAPPPGREDPDERKLRGAGERGHRHHARLRRTEACRHREHSEGDAVHADGDADPGGITQRLASRGGDCGDHTAIIRLRSGHLLAFYAF
jgi:hypothetical protein